MKRKKLLIDANSLIAHCLTGYPSGIGRTTYELLKTLARMDRLPFDVELLTQNLWGKTTKGLLPFDNTHIYLPDRVILKKLVCGLRLRQLATHYDLYHIPHNTDICEVLPKTVFTIHDLMAYRYPDMWNVTEEEKAYHRKVARKGKAFITCSECSKKDIVDFWGVPEERVVSIPWGVDRGTFRPVEGRSYCDAHGIGDHFYFSASCNHARKNAPLMLEAFNQYVARGGKGQLVLLNPSEADMARYPHLVEQGKAIAVRKVPDADLVELYSRAHCSIVASSFEGFGLPVLESLACGTQVICAHNSSLIEAGGDVVSFLPELTAEELCESLLRFDGIRKDRTLDTSLTLRHLSEFTWERCTEKYVETYERLLYEE